MDIVEAGEVDHDDGSDSKKRESSTLSLFPLGFQRHFENMSN